MDKFTQLVVTHKKIIFVMFIITALISGFLSTLVDVNYDMVDYLPQDANSTQAIEIMKDEFGSELPNGTILLNNVSITEALSYKDRISNVTGVTDVTWLDDIIGLNTMESVPIEFIDSKIIEPYYKNGNALLTVTISGGMEKAAASEIYAIIGEGNNANGEAFSSAETQSMSVSEVVNAMAILLPIIILILILSTNSWVEPIFFLATIGIAIIINMGTNLIFGEISFITKTVSPVLQLAVSLDYAIFLLHSFNDYRTKHDPTTAMKLSMKEAMPTVAASAGTTVIGFLALVFMKFGIGADLGLSLFKGIMFSFVTVIVFLPVVTLMFYKIIDKTMHRRLMPDFKRSGKALMKIRVPMMILALIIVIPAFLAQSSTDFMYGMGGITKESRIGTDTKVIEAKFGKQNTLALLVPKLDPGVEETFSEELSKIPNVKNVVSYSTAIGPEVPVEYVSEAIKNQFYSENYSRIILYINTLEEGDKAFKVMEDVKATAEKYYDETYIAGQSSTLFDMKGVVSRDITVTNTIAVIGIFIILYLTFRSIFIPLILLFTIETAIWINLSFPYFTDSKLSFIGYLIISTVQLGATVDYAILLTNAYHNNRKTMGVKEAMEATIHDNLVAIVISAGILSLAGFILALTTSNPIIRELGTLLGRGTILSLLMVSSVLPALILIFDKRGGKS